MDGAKPTQTETSPLRHSQAARSVLSCLRVILSSCRPCNILSMFHSPEDKRGLSTMRRCVRQRSCAVLCMKCGGAIAWTTVLVNTAPSGLRVLGEAQRSRQGAYGHAEVLASPGTPAITPAIATAGVQNSGSPARARPRTPARAKPGTPGIPGKAWKARNSSKGPNSRNSS